MVVTTDGPAGSYRIATAPEPNCSRLTSFKSTYFDIPAHELGVPVGPVQGARHDVLHCRVDRPGEGFHPRRPRSRPRRPTPSCLQQADEFVSQIMPFISAARALQTRVRQLRAALCSSLRAAPSNIRIAIPPVAIAMQLMRFAQNRWTEHPPRAVYAQPRRDHPVHLRSSESGCPQVDRRGWRSTHCRTAQGALLR